MKRVLIAVLVLLVGLLLWAGVRVIVRGLASDETRVRWLVEEMTEGFNDTRMNPILHGLAQEFVDDGSGAHKDDVRAGLASLFLQRKDPKTKRFPYRARIEPEDFKVSLHVEQSKGADADFVLVLEQSDGEEQWRETWRADVHAQLAEDSGDWWLVRTRIDTRAGRQPR